jgi:transcriptional regulator
MMSDVVQTLLGTRVENPAHAADWVERLSQPGMLTHRQAEVVVRLYGRDESRQEVAAALGTTASNVDNIRRAASEKLRGAEATLREIEKMRQAVRPDA